MPGSTPAVDVTGGNGTYALQFTIPQGPTGPANGLNSYGGLYSTTNEPLTLTGGADTPITLATPMANENVTQAANTITIQNPGNYEISYWVQANGTPAGSITVIARNATAEIPGTSQTLPVDGTNDVIFSGNTIVALTTGDTISLAASSDDVTTANIVAASLSVKQLN